MAEPQVTVGIATYNGAKYLPQQLDTILSQTHRNLNVVAVDDASTDETVKLLEDYARRYPVKVFRNPTNLGFIRNFEKVLRECHAAGSPFIALADQDDIWRSNKIETLLRHIGDASLIYNPAEWTLYANGTTGRPAEHKAYIKFCRRRGTGCRIFELLANNFVVSHQMLFRREIIPEAVPFPPGLMYHDHWIALTAARLRGIKFLQADLMIYRQHSSSATFAGVMVQRSFWSKIETWFARHSTFLTTIRGRDALLAGWEQLPGFTAVDYAFMRRLRSLYKAMLQPGPHWSGAFAAIWLNRYFFSPTLSAMIRYYLSAFFGTRLTRTKK